MVFMLQKSTKSNILTSLLSSYSFILIPGWNNDNVNGYHSVANEENSNMKKFTSEQIGNLFQKFLYILNYDNTYQGSNRYLTG